MAKGMVRLKDMREGSERDLEKEELVKVLRRGVDIRKHAGRVLGNGNKPGR
jgi:hypothetical protein